MNDNSASGIGSLALGFKNSALTNFSFVAGNSNMSQSESETVLGMFARIYSPANNLTDRIFACSA
jgi:hypothetical protein